MKKIGLLIFLLGLLGCPDERALQGAEEDIEESTNIHFSSIFNKWVTDRFVPSQEQVEAISSFDKRLKAAAEYRYYDLLKATMEIVDSYSSTYSYAYSEVVYILAKDGEEELLIHTLENIKKYEDKSNLYYYFEMLFSGLRGAIISKREKIMKTVLEKIYCRPYVKYKPPAVLFLRDIDNENDSEALGIHKLYFSVFGYEVYKWYSDLDEQELEQANESPSDTLKKMIKTYGEEVDSKIRYPATAFGIEESFLLLKENKHFNDYITISTLFKGLNEIEGLELTSSTIEMKGDLPVETIVKIFKYVDVKSIIELIFLYSNRDLSSRELRYIEENEWNDLVGVNVCDENGLTMLHKLCYYGHKNKVNFLLGKGALKNMGDREGKTPLWYAEKGAKDGKYGKDAKFMIWIKELKSRGLTLI